MVKLGRLNILKVVKKVEFGLYLDGGHFGEVLLPERYAPKGIAVNTRLEIFLHLDSQDRLVATTETPYGYVGDTVYLRVTDVNRTGAFLNWGMPKDLFVPFSEQRVPMEEGRSYCVYLYIDNTDRIAASSKLSLYLDEYNDRFKPKQAVSLLVVSRSDLGYTAAINGTHLGLIHNSDILQPLRMGQAFDGFIKNIREDGKIDLALKLGGFKATNDLSEQILEFLNENDGETTLTDKSSPEAIFKQYRTSKASYKKALGRLLKLKKINITKERVTRVK